MDSQSNKSSKFRHEQGNTNKGIHDKDDEHEHIMYIHSIR